MQKSTIARLSAAAASVALLIASAPVYASPTSTLSQLINPGTLTTDIRNASRVAVASPAVSLSAVTTTFACQTPGSSGTLGTNTERVYVDNPSASDTGYVLSIAASAPTAVWSDGTHTFDFNDPTTGGCTDSADADSVAGQMTIDPSVSTLTQDYTSGNTTGLTKGSSTAFVQSSADSITLINGGAGSDDVGRWYQTGIAITQTIPEMQHSGTYTLPLTVSVVAQ